MAAVIAVLRALTAAVKAVAIESCPTCISDFRMFFFSLRLGAFLFFFPLFNRVDKLDDKVAAMNDDVDKLNNKVASLSDKVDKLRSDLRDEIRDMRNELRDLLEEVLKKV